MSRNYTHHQSTPADVWIVTHGLNALPNIDVTIEENGVRQKILVDRVVYIDENSLEIRFNSQRVGQVRVIAGTNITYASYDAYTIIQAVDYFPYKTFTARFDSLARIPQRTSEPSTSTISVQNGRLYTIITNLTASEARVIVYDNPYDLNVITDIPNIPYSGNHSIKNCTVWNDVMYFISHDNAASLNNTTLNDDTVWRIDLNTTTISSVQYPQYDGFNGLTTDGEFLYATTWVGPGTPVSMLKLNMTDLTVVESFAGNAASQRYSHVTFDHEFQLFYVVPSIVGSSLLYVLDGFNGSVIHTTQLGSNTPTDINNLFIYGPYVYVANTTDFINPIQIKWLNTTYRPVIDTTSAGSTCALTGPITKAYHLLVPGASHIYMSPYTRAVYVSNNTDPTTITKFESLLDETIVEVYTLPEIVSLKDFVVHEDKIHALLTTNEYVRYDISDPANVIEETTFVLSFFNTQSRDTTHLSMQAYDGDIFFFAKTNLFPYQASTFTLPVGAFNSGNLVAESVWNINNDTSSVAQYIDIDIVTGYRHTVHTTNNGTSIEYNVHPGVGTSTRRLASYNSPFSSQIPDNMICYGGRLYYQLGTSIISYPTAVVPSLLYNNNACSL